MEPENFQKENNNHTLTNILLFLLLLVMVVILFFVIKNQKKESSEIVYVPAEQFPSSNTQAVIPTNSTNSNPTLTQENIPLTVGQQYSTVMSIDENPEWMRTMTYCGESEMSNDDVDAKSYYYFLPISQGCSDDMPGGQEGAQYISKTIFYVSAKPTTTSDQVAALNKKYGVKQLSNQKEFYHFQLPSGTSTYNVYTIAKIYLDSGYFWGVSLKDIRYLEYI